MDEQHNEPSFEELLKESEAMTRMWVRQGEKLDGRVIMISGDVAHIDIGMRSEAILPRTEDPRFEALQEGAQIEVYVTKAGKEVQLSLDPVLGLGDFSQVAEAFESEEILEGQVTAVNKGGFDINIAGVRCFCPFSQISEQRVENPQDLIGSRLPFKITECDVNSENAVVSHRAHLKDLRDEAMRELRMKIQSGAVLKGSVVEIKGFGAFVDLGGIHGLLHISEISHQRVDHVSDYLSVGDEIEVEVLSVEVADNGRERIALSMRALQPDPWDNLGFEKGAAVSGRVVRKKEYGIFVNVREGVDGLLPRRFLRRAGRSVDLDDFSEGQEIDVEIVGIDLENRRISLALPGWDEEVISELKPGEGVKVRVRKIIPAGLLVECIDDPATGLIPKRFLGSQSHRSMETDYAAGKELDAVVESIDEQGRYAFSLRTEKEELDPKVLEKFTSEKDQMGFNPFSDFFNNRD